MQAPNHAASVDAPIGFPFISCARGGAPLSSTGMLPKKSVFALAVALVCVGLLGAAFLYPLFRYAQLTRRWEAQIRSQQDPAQLQAWATNLLATHAREASRRLTNRPPAGIPTSRYGPEIWVMAGKGEGDYVRLVWGGGHLPPWGIEVGNIDLVRSGPGVWRPGICFFTP
ncbi:MAG TPA: hypothetical protein VLT36_18575 [Candidatus Dormibacteraeota bacterium]|nr:hypothetical protein [Candidatus Dormibacteraeota bacterium]